MTLPAPVARAVDQYLTAVDADAPGLVEGLHLVGSVALDDFRAGRSDVDFVAVTGTAPGAAEVAALRRAHRRLRRTRDLPAVNGVYVTAADLARDPAAARAVPHVAARRFHPAARGALNPVTWHTLARHGIPCRGDLPGPVWNDDVVLTDWCATNLRTYWYRWYRRARRPVSALALATYGDWAPSWAVLGVARIRYTLDTGEITSKTAAGEYALETFPARWHPLLSEALRLRTAPTTPAAYPHRHARRRALLAYLTEHLEPRTGG